MPHSSTYTRFPSGVPAARFKRPSLSFPDFSEYVKVSFTSDAAFLEHFIYGLRANIKLFRELSQTPVRTPSGKRISPPLFIPPKRGRLFKLSFPTATPLGINSKRFFHFLKCIPRVFIFDYAQPKFFIVCHAL
jgi:hypothetical protein